MSRKSIALPACRWGILLSLWTGGLYGCLQIVHLSGNWGHWICGPWGCGPRLQALLACHGFWLMLLWPPAILLKRRLDPGTGRLTGNVLLGLGVLSLVSMTLYQAITWLPATRSAAYFLHRVLFVIATQIEIPTVEVIVVGLYLRWTRLPTTEEQIAAAD